MEKIGFPLQPWDPNRMKSFGPSTSGCILGVWIDSVSFTYNFAPRKLNLMIQFVEQCYLAPALTLNQMQQMMGKIHYLSTIDHAFSTATGFLANQLQAYLRLHPHWEDIPISNQSADIVLSPPSKQDIMVLRALLKMLADRQFPLEVHHWHNHSRAIYTDASGVLGQGVGGVLLSSPLSAFAIPLPDGLLTSGLGHIAFVPMSWRTCPLELLPVWASLMHFAAEIKHCHVIFYMDNSEAVMAIQRRTSADYTTCLLIRLILFTASILDVHVDVAHVNRRSDVFSKVADDLTHFNYRSLFRADKRARYEFMPNLPPVNLWFHMFANCQPTPLFRAIMDYVSALTGAEYLLPDVQSLMIQH